MRAVLPERRSCPRVLTDLDGWVAADRQQPIPCKLWDISEKGVRLVFPEPCEVPVEFEIRIPSRNAVARARLIWSDGYYFGAQFQD